MTTTTSSNGRATNGRAIRVEQAEIRTATVTISALKIDTRQVTQSVFKQLIEEPVANFTTGQFNGLPWGTVNYCPPGCQATLDEHGRRHHLHVIWQKGDELRRAAEWNPGRFEPRVEGADQWLLLALAEGWRPDRWDTRGYGPSRVNVQFIDGARAVHCRLPDAAIHHFCEYEHDATYNTDRGRDALARGAQAVRDELHVSTSTEIAERIVDDIREQHKAWLATRERWGELEALPQLFIAA